MFPRQYVELLCTCASAFLYVSVPLSPVVFCEALAPVHLSGVCVQAFCCVQSCTCTSACLELALVSLCSQWSSVVHMHMDASCIRCSTLLPSSIAGLFPHTLSWFHSIYYTSVTGALVPLLCGGSWLGCQDWLAMGAVSSRSWLPIVEAPRYLEHSSSM